MVAHSLIRSVLLLATTAFASSVVQLQPGLRLRGGRSGGPLGRLPGVNLLAEQKEVLVTGGVGYIGSHTVLELLQANYRVVIVDNLCNSNLACLERVQKIAGKEVAFHNVDIRDKEGLAAVFAQHSVGAVIHFAGLKAVGESVAQPLMYYQVNVEGTLNLLEAMDDAGVGDIVFSSSATVYGDPATVPVTESFPTGPTNPYGHSKLFNEQILRDFAASRPEWNVCLLRYFNPVGAHPSGMIGEDPKGIPNNLMPYIQQVAVGKRPHLAVFGDDYPTADGTGVRDYIHVRAQIRELRNSHPGAAQPSDDVHLHTPLRSSTSPRVTSPRSRSSRRARGASRTTLAPASATASWTCSRRTPRRAARSWRTRWRRGAPATSPWCTRIQLTPPTSWAGRPSEISSRCARTRGGGSRRTLTDSINQSSCI